MQLLNTLYLTTPDTYLRLDNDTLRVEVDHETRLRVPLHHLSAVVCFGHIGLSAPLMHRLAEGGIALVLLDDNGRFIDSEVFILKYSVMPSHGDDGNHRHEKAFA